MLVAEINKGEDGALREEISLVDKMWGSLREKNYNEALCIGDTAKPNRAIV